MAFSTLAYPLFHPSSRASLPLTLSKDEFASEFPGESDYVEFKSGVSGPQLQDTAVAFSNVEGGVILVGVADDGTVRGRRLDSGTQDDVHQALNSARDVGRYSLHELDVDGTAIVVVAVSRRREGFAQTSGGVVKVRRGTRDDPLFGMELVRFANERTANRYETTSTSLAIDAISAELRADVRDAYGWSRATTERLREAELLDGDQLTVAGALFLVPDAEPELGKVYVEVRRYTDDVTIDYDRRDGIRGPIHHVLTSTVARVADELGTEMVVIGTRRFELSRLPEVVIREAIANGLAHRSYEMAGSPVTVELRPSAVIVRSPGGLPEPVTVENLREANAARNRAVIAVLRRMRLAEDAGRGIDVMQDTMAEQMLDPPTFEDHGHEVVVRLPIQSVVTAEERAWLLELEHRSALEPGDRLVLVHAARGDQLTNQRVRTILGTEDRLLARKTLARLETAGFLSRSGQRGGATYRLASSLRAPAGLQLSREELDDVIVKLAQAGPIRNADVRKVTGLDRAQALAHLDSLVEDGRLVRSGQRRGTTYAVPQ